MTGAPETFLVDKEGVIRVHHLGDINDRVWRNKFVPVLTEMGELIHKNTDEVGS